MALDLETEGSSGEEYFSFSDPSSSNEDDGSDDFSSSEDEVLDIDRYESHHALSQYHHHLRLNQLSMSQPLSDDDGLDEGPLQTEIHDLDICKPLGEASVGVPGKLSRALSRTSQKLLHSPDHDEHLMATFNPLFDKLNEPQPQHYNSKLKADVGRRLLVSRQISHSIKNLNLGSTMANTTTTPTVSRIPTPVPEPTIKKPCARCILHHAPCNRTATRSICSNCLRAKNCETTYHSKTLENISCYKDGGPFGEPPSPTIPPPEPLPDWRFDPEIEFAGKKEIERLRNSIFTTAHPEAPEISAPTEMLRRDSANRHLPMKAMDYFELRRQVKKAREEMYKYKELSFLDLSVAEVEEEFSFLDTNMVEVECLEILK